MEYFSQKALPEENLPLFQVTQKTLEEFELDVQLSSISCFFGKNSELKKRLEICEIFQFVSEVKNCKIYEENWLRCLELQENPEETFFHLFRNGILTSNWHFYWKWIVFYCKNNQFVFACQVIDLSGEHLTENNTYQNTYTDLFSKFVVKSACFALAKDFYEQEFYLFHVNSNAEELHKYNIMISEFHMKILKKLSYLI